MAAKKVAAISGSRQIAVRVMVCAFRDHRLIFIGGALRCE